MALFAADSVWFNATSTGTVDFVVASAVSGYRTPAGASVPNGSTLHYSARVGADFENGEGIYNSATLTLARTTIFASSNANAKVNFGSVPTVALAPLAEDVIFPPNSSTDGAIVAWLGTGADNVQDTNWKFVSNKLFRDDTGTFAWDNTFGSGGTTPELNILRKLTVAEITNPVVWIYGEAPGDAATQKGMIGQYIELADPASITSGQRGNLWGLFVGINPRFDRVNGNGTEDANGLMIKNIGSAKAFSAIYISGRGDSPDLVSWENGLEIHGSMQTGMSIQSGQFFRGIDVVSSVGFTDCAIRVPSLRIDQSTTGRSDSAGNLPVLATNNTTVATTSWMNALFNATAANAPVIEFGRSKSGTVGTFTAVASGDALGELSWMGADGSQFRDAATILSEVDGSVSSNVMPGRLKFMTTATAGVLERWRIDSSGLMTAGGFAAFAVDGAFISSAIVTGGNSNLSSGNWGMGLIICGANAANPGFLSAKTRNTTPTTHTAVQGNDQLWRCDGYGSDGTAYRQAGSIFIVADPTGTISGSSMPGRLSFQVSPDGNNAGTSEYLRIDCNGGVYVRGGGAGLGYGVSGSSDGGTVTQATSRTTAVTLNKLCGAITLFNTAGSTTANTFTVNDSKVAATDVIILCQKSGTDKYDLCVTRVAAGAFDITFRTFSGTTAEAPVFAFAVIKAVTN